MTRKDSAFSKVPLEDQNLDGLMIQFEPDTTALDHENGPKTADQNIYTKEDEDEDVGFEVDDADYDFDDYSDGDEDDGGFQDYEDWKEENRTIAPAEERQIPTQIPVDNDRVRDMALEELIKSIQQDSIDLGLETPTRSGEGEYRNDAGEAEVQIREDDSWPPSPADGPSTPPRFIFRPLPIRQPASMPAASHNPPASWPIGQQPLPNFVPPMNLITPSHIPFQPTRPLHSTPGLFTVPGSLRQTRPNQSVLGANTSLPSLPGPRPTQRPAAQVSNRPAPAPPTPAQATHYAGPSRRVKPKTRLASKMTPRLPNGTIDFEVKTCIHEMKRDGSEFDFNGNLNGNQKCARVLKSLYPNKFPDWISENVLADRLQQTWYARSDRPGRKQTLAWKRIVEMRNGDEALRRALRVRIRGTGVR